MERRKAASRITLAAVSAALAVLLAGAGVYAYAKYVTSYTGLEAGTDMFDVSTSMAYWDYEDELADGAFGEDTCVSVSDGNLGAVKPDSSGKAYFRLTVENRCVFAVSCSLSIGEGFLFETWTGPDAAEDGSSYTVSDDSRTLTLDGTIEAGEGARVYFAVAVDEDFEYDDGVDDEDSDDDDAFLGVRSGDLEIRVRCDQAG